MFKIFLILFSFSPNVFAEKVQSSGAGENGPRYAEQNTTQSEYLRQCLFNILKAEDEQAPRKPTFFTKPAEPLGIPGTYKENLGVFMLAKNSDPVFVSESAMQGSNSVTRHNGKLSRERTFRFENISYKYLCSLNEPTDCTLLREDLRGEPQQQTGTRIDPETGTVIQMPEAGNSKEEEAQNAVASRIDTETMKSITKEVEDRIKKSLNAMVNGDHGLPGFRLKAGFCACNQIAQLRPLYDSYGPKMVAKELNWSSPENQDQIVLSFNKELSCPK